MPIDRSIEHNNRTGYGSLCPGGLRMESFPMRLFRKGNKKFWNPEDIDFSRDAEYGPAYDLIFKEEQPKAMWALVADPSPAAQVRASVTYNHIVEGCLALTGYYAWAKVCNSRNILPGMQKLIKHIGDDERRH